MQKALEHSNDELSTRLLEIKEKLTAQSKKSQDVERQVEDTVVSTLFQKELQEALLAPQRTDWPATGFPGACPLLDEWRRGSGRQPRPRA